MAEFKWFRHRQTGLIGYYPADFDDLFEDFEEVPSTEDVPCIDCAPKENETLPVIQLDAPDPARRTSQKNEDK